MGLPEQTKKVQLPITDFKAQILEIIKQNQVSIVVAGTGAGKSTQVPKYLLEAGYEVVVTQPRRIAARTVAERVAFEYGSKLGDTIGFRTMHEHQQSSRTKCLFVTDGLALVRELIGARKQGTILVIDEVHEWNMNIEVLIGYVKHLLKTDKVLKVVLMSATLETEALSKHFNNAPVIDVPGNIFPIEDRTPCGDMITDTINLLRQGHNVLVFQPGKKEIEEMTHQLKQSGVSAEILPLHAELTSAEQARCFMNFPRPKCVIATNVAQTSITIDDIDAVVDSGMERRTELVNSVEGLYLKPISFADSKQRRGRAGRCKQGIYIDYCPETDRLEFAKAEILRSLLDQVVLRLAQQGFDAEELEFFHQPDIEAIRKAKASLKLIGCMDENGHVTQIGNLVAQLPVEVQYGRMLVEAKKLGVLSDVLTIVAILEVGGIIDRSTGAWRYLCPGEYESDLLAQLAIYNQCYQQSNEWMKQKGIHIKSLRKARENRAHIVEKMPNTRLSSTGNRKDIIKATCAGFVEHVFVESFGSYKPMEMTPTSAASRFCMPTFRNLNKDSVVTRRAKIVVGIPFDLSIPHRDTLKLVTMATVVDLDILRETAPQLIREVKGINPRYDHLQECVVSETRVYFGAGLLQSTTQPDPEHPEAASIIAEATKPKETYPPVGYMSPTVRRWGDMGVGRFGSRRSLSPMVRTLVEDVAAAVTESPVIAVKPASLKPTGTKVLSSFAEL